MQNYGVFTQIYVLQELEEKKQNSAQNGAKISIVQRKGQCRDIRLLVLRHYVETLLQCHDIATTSSEEGKAKICQCRDIKLDPRH